MGELFSRTFFSMDSYSLYMFANLFETVFIGLCLHICHCSFFSCLYSKMCTWSAFTYLTTRGDQVLGHSVGWKDGFCKGFNWTWLWFHRVIYAAPQCLQICVFYIVVIVYVCFIFDIARSSHVFNSHNQCTMWMSPRELDSVKRVNRPVTF